MLRFVPPKLLSKYAVFVDYGNHKGFFRTYDDLGHAKSSFRNQTSFNWGGVTTLPGKILEMIDGEWFTLYDIPKDSTRLPWQKDFGTQASRWHYGRTGIQTVPMTREEYGDWRSKVERERLNIVLAGNASINEGGN